MNEYRSATASHANGNCTEVGAYRKSSYSIYSSCAEVGTEIVNARTSTYSESGVNCTEIGNYRKSSASINDATGGSECAEVGSGDLVVTVRDTKEEDLGPARTVLEFSPRVWTQFLGTIR